MATKNQNILSLSHLSSLLLLVVLVLVNALFARASTRIDLTEDGIYTLSDGSKRILGDLRDPATLRVFWHDVPELGENMRLYLEALLDEMKSASHGRLTVRWVDLGDEDGEREASEAGVQKTPFQQVTEGEVRLAEGYDSLVVEMGDKKEVIGQLVGKGEQLEYLLVSTIAKMARADDLVVGLVAPRPAFNPFGGGSAGRFRAIQQLLDRQYESSARTSMSLDEPVPPDVSVLVVLAPEDLEEQQVWHLEQFVLRGGKALVCLDPVSSQVLEHPGGRPQRSGLEDWLSHLGVTVEAGVVGDKDQHTGYPRRVQTALGPMIEFVRYPYWPVLTAEHLDQENPATRGWDQIPLFWPAALAVDEAAQAAAGRTFSVLARTSDGGFHVPDLVGIERGTVPSTGFREIPLMVLLEGPMTSMWERKPGEPRPAEAGEPAAGEEGPSDGEAAPADGGEAPAGEGAAPADGEAEPADGEAEPADDGEAEPADDGEAEPADDGEAPPADDEASPGGDEAPPPEGATGPDETEDAVAEDAGPPHLTSGAGLLVLVTDAELVDDTAAYLGQQLQRGYDNGFPFVLNVVDWMSGNEDLLSLRARDRKPRLLDEEVKGEEQRVWKWVNLAGMPVLLLFAGIVVFLVRRYQR